MSLPQAKKFLLRVGIVLLVLAIIAGILIGLQLLFHPFDEVIATIATWLDTADKTMNQELLTGISIGLIVLILVVFLIPLTLRSINKKQYLVATQRGIVASFVFLATSWLYDAVEKYNRFWLVVAVAGVALVTFILIEVMALLMKKDEEVAFRTDIVASIVSGLIFSGVIKLVGLIGTTLHV